MEIKASGNCPICKKTGSMLIYTGRDKQFDDKTYQRILKCSDCGIVIKEDQIRSMYEGFVGDKLNEDIHETAVVESGIKAGSRNYVYVDDYVFHDGIVKFKENDLYGYIDESGKIICEPQFDYAEEFQNGVAIFAINGQWKETFDLNLNDELSKYYDGGKYGVINKNGETIIEPVWNKLEYFKDNILKARSDKDIWGKDGYYSHQEYLYGLIDYHGGVIIDAIYKQGHFYYVSKDLIVVKYYSNGYHSKLFNAKTNTYIYDTYRNIEVTDGGIIRAEKHSGEFVYIDENGNDITDNELKIQFDKGVIKVKTVSNNFSYSTPYTKKLCYFDIYDKKIEKLGCWDYARQFSDGLAAVAKGGEYKIIVDKEGGEFEEYRNGKYGFINTEGNVVIELIWDDVSDFKKGLACVGKNHLYGLINTKGELVCTPRWEWHSGMELDIDNQLIKVKNDGLYGYVNLADQVIIEPIYEFLSSFNDGKASARKNGSDGYVNLNGEFTSKTKDSRVAIETEVCNFWVYYFSEGLARIRTKNGLYGFVNKKYDTVIEPIWDDATDFKEGLSIVIKDGNGHFINQQGEIVNKANFDFLGTDLIYVLHKVECKKEDVLEFLQKFPTSFSIVCDELKNDRDIATIALQLNGKNLEFLNEEFQNDKQLVMEAIKQNPKAIEFASKRLQSDRTLLILVLEKYPLFYKELDVTLKEDLELANISLTQNPSLIEFAPDSIRDDKEIIDMVIEKDISLFKYLGDNAKSNKDIVLKVVSNNGLNLEYTTYELKDDYDVVLEAIKQNPKAIKFAPDSLKDTKEIILLVLETNQDYYDDLSDELKNDEDIILKIVSCNPEWIEKTSKFNDIEYFKEHFHLLSKVTHLYNLSNLEDFIIEKCSENLTIWNEIFANDKVIAKITSKKLIEFGLTNKLINYKSLSTYFQQDQEIISLATELGEIISINDLSEENSRNKKTIDLIKKNWGEKETQEWKSYQSSRRFQIIKLFWPVGVVIIVLVYLVGSMKIEENHLEESQRESEKRAEEFRKKSPQEQAEILDEENQKSIQNIILEIKNPTTNIGSDRLTTITLDFLENLKQDEIQPKTQEAIVVLAKTILSEMKPTDVTILKRCYKIIVSASDRLNNFNEAILFQQKIVALNKNIYSYRTDNEKIKEDYIDSLGSLSWYFILSKQYKEAVIAGTTAIEIEQNNNDWIQINIAHGLLFQGKVKEAKKIYLKYQSKKVNDTSFKQFVLDDFEVFRKQGGFSEELMDQIEQLYKK